MKRLSLLGFFGLWASILAGCPIYSGDGNPTGQCWDGNCNYGGYGGYTQFCSSSAQCSQNEVCGQDQQCHSGDCTVWGCASGACVVDPATLVATCNGGGGAGGGGHIITGTGGASGGAGGTTTTSGSGGATGGTGGTTGGTGGATGGAGGTTTTTTAAPACTLEGQQGECAQGSICLHNLCWISCDAPNQNACDQQVTLNTCQIAIDQNKTLHSVCDLGTTGTECSIPSQLCTGGLDCINGYCR